MAKKFQADLFEEFKAHYNIAPMSHVPIVRFDEQLNKRVITQEYWGLVPYWAKNPKIAAHTSNARSESVTEKASFKNAFKKRRCIIPIDGFYEWDRSVKPSQPYYFCMEDEEPFGLAGIWESWKVRWLEDPEEGKKPKPIQFPIKLGGQEFNQGEVLESCSILTTEANSLMKKVHDRMPVILDPRNYGIWLDPKIEDAGILRGLLKPYTAQKMKCWPVDRLVNKVGNDAPDCIKEVKI